MNVTRLFALAIPLALLVFPKAYADDQKSDEQILGILMTADKGEMDAAQQAMGKNISNDAMNYAKMLLKDHGDDYKKLQELSNKTGIQPSPTAGAMMKADAAKELALRTVLNGHDFEKAYINDMVKDHTDDINLIDTDLSKDAKNSDLKSAITDVRSHMQQHLDMAKQLQSKL